MPFASFVAHIIFVQPKPLCFNCTDVFINVMPREGRMGRSKKMSESPTIYIVGCMNTYHRGIVGYWNPLYHMHSWISESPCSTVSTYFSNKIQCNQNPQGIISTPLECHIDWCLNVSGLIISLLVPEVLYKNML